MKYSIITAVYNSEDFIEKTILSVLNQTYDNIEYIVIDGKSTDNTTEIIKKYADRIDYFISEPDNGVYDAMNKGIEAATGDYLYFLNSGDYFVDETIIYKINSKLATQDINILTGNVIIYNNDSNCISKHSNFDKKYLRNHTICHQAMFSKRGLFAKYGVFDIKYKLKADHDWFMQVYDTNANIKYVDYNIAYFLDGGLSSSGSPLTAKEYFKIGKKHYSSISDKIFLYSRYYIYMLSWKLGIVALKRKIFNK